MKGCDLLKTELNHEGILLAGILWSTWFTWTQWRAWTSGTTRPSGKNGRTNYGLDE